MKWNYSLRGNSSGPTIRDMVMYDATTIVDGQALKFGTTTGLSYLIDGAQLGADFVGVAQETIAASTTALATGTLVYGKVALDPDAVWLTEQDLTASADIDVVSSTTTAVTLGSCDDDLDGSWIYCNTGTGAGQLGFVGEASTTVFTLDTTSAFGTAPDSTTDVVLIRRKGPGGRDLDSTQTKMLTDEDETGKFLVLENYISGKRIPFAVLHPRQHHGLSGLSSSDVTFYSDLYPTDHALRGAATI